MSSMEFGRKGPEGIKGEGVKGEGASGWDELRNVPFRGDDLNDNLGGEYNKELEELLARIQPEVEVEDKNTEDEINQKVRSRMTEEDYNDPDKRAKAELEVAEEETGKLVTETEDQIQRMKDNLKRVFG